MKRQATVDFKLPSPLISVIDRNRNVSEISSPEPAKTNSRNFSTQEAKSGILKNQKSRLQKEDTVVSQSPKKTRKAGSSWRHKQERMMLYHMQKAFKFDEFKRLHIEALTEYKKNDSKMNLQTLYLKQVLAKNEMILNVVEQTPLELLMNYDDRWPLLTIRKTISRFMLHVQQVACVVMTNKIFETSCILVILANSFTLAMEDPSAVTQTPTQDLLDNIFQALYTVEMIVKILGLGFIFNGKKSYLRDIWNILDFIIVMSSYLTLIQTYIQTLENDGVPVIKTRVSQEENGLSLNSLRAFRVLRPLRAITSIKGLQVLVSAVLNSLPLLQDTILVILSFFLVFAIAGSQLLTGLLKQRCISIEDGTVYLPNYLCGGSQTCPDKYFCGKLNANPNFGVTNFDNLMYALLVVFECVTLEGWSDIMVAFMQAWTIGAVFYFMPIVFIGAFFLCNLLLAVINSSFSVAHKAQQMKLAAIKAKAKLLRKAPLSEDHFNDDEPIDQIGVTQYWIAQRAAKQMIPILRAAQERKKAEAKKDSIFSVLNQIQPEVVKDDKLQGPVPQKKEEEEEEDFSIQVVNFIKEDVQPNAPVKDQDRQIKDFAVSEMRVAHRMNAKQFARVKGVEQTIETTDARNLARKSKRTKKYQGNLSNLNYFRQQLDISNILLKADQHGKETSDCQHRYDLSQNYSEIQNYEEDTDDDLKRRASLVVPDQSNLDHSEQSSVIHSDSSFEHKLEQLDGDKEEKLKTQQFEVKYQQAKQMTDRSYQKATVQKAEKLEVIGGVEEGVEVVDYIENLVQTAKKKKKKRNQVMVNHTDLKYTHFKQTIREIDKAFIAQQQSQNPYDFINKKTHKVEILSGMPYLSSSNADVFEIRNREAEQLALSEANPFVQAAHGSEHEYNIQGYSKPLCEAYQLKTCYQIQIEDPVEFDSDDDDALILALQPYDTVTSVGYGHLLTQKPIKFITRKSDILVSSTLQLTLTPSDFGYRPMDQALLSREQIELWSRKRDVYRALQVTTASFLTMESLQPTHSDLGKNKNASFRSGKSKQQSFKSAKSSPKIQKDRSHNSEDRSDIVNDGILGPTPPAEVAAQYVKVIPDTLLTKPLPQQVLTQMSEDEKRLYHIQKGKYDTYMRILSKKSQLGEHPKDRRFSLKEVDKLLVGAHHDQEEEIQEAAQLNTEYMSRAESFLNSKLEHFDHPPPHIQKKKDRPKFEYIPKEIKLEFDLPEDLQGDTINFDQVLIKDCSVKRRVPQWSGQDVLCIGLTTSLAEIVIDQINNLRVWPKGVSGSIKKARVFLKMIVKNPMFGNAMTFCVLLNTIAMGMERYGIDEDTSRKLDSAGIIFTWIFIGEMASKIIAVGITKYLSDKMNWLDGGVVSLSIMELVMTAVTGGGGNLSAFRTVRVFRTFRVLRVARLLRALKSMQVILAVITRSASSFVYITILMFVFIFIYTLLGMEVFGNQFNFEDGVPRGNYDNFVLAFFTVFQVLTTESWHVVLYDSMRSQKVGLYIPALFYVSWIFIGNFILLDLFLAILLDGFLAEDDEEEGDVEELKRIEAEKRKFSIQKEKVRRLKKMGADVSFSNKISKKEKKQEEFIDNIDDLNEQEIREIFIDEGITKNKSPEREARLLYQGISCNKSLYLFSKQNKLRTFLFKVYKHKMFDHTVMALIAISSLKLATDSYLVNYSDDSIQQRISKGIDIFTNICFLLECIVKNIVMGTIMDEGAYLKESWNQLDAFIVFTSMLDMCFSNINIPIIKILRLLRTLRPLRVISHNVAMKLIVASLFESVGSIFNVVIVILCVWLMFGIFAINIFAGKFFYCSIGKYHYHTKYDCNSAGGSWLVPEQNFDDIFQAMLTLFNVASLEGWTDVLHQAIDTVDVDVGPKLNSSVIYGFFFVVFVLIGSFFLMNFFVGVLFLKYTQAAKNEMQGYTEENLVWLDIQKMIIDQKCPHELMNKPDMLIHPVRYKYWRIVNSKTFEVFILSVIVLNIVQMGINFENAPTLYVFLVGITNYFFTAVFCAEMYLKFRAYKWRYFDTLQHKFDFFIVCSSIIDILMTLTTTDSSISIGPQLAKILRVLRVTRVVRLAGKNEGLQALMQTITLSVGSLANVFLLLLLVIFIFSVLAVFFFNNITSGVEISEYKNFTNFGQSFLFLFILSTGENWNYAMYDCIKTAPNCVENETCGTSYAPVFFVIFVLFVQNIMLNLFILVIINQFEKYYMAEDNPITKFKKNLDVFMVTWVDFTATKYRCYKLKEKQLNDFFKKLPMPIGLPQDATEDQMKRMMLRMGIRCDDGYIYFNELLYRCMRRQYGSFRLNKRMQINELKIQYAIYMIKLRAQSLFNRKDPEELFFQNIAGSSNQVNPFLQEMYYSISFTTWLHYARKMQKRERHLQKQEVKKQANWAKGKEFVPDLLMEAKQELKYVQIEVETIVYITTDSESDSENDESQSPGFGKVKVLTLNQLKTKKSVRPQGSTVQSRRKDRLPLSTRGFSVLDLLRKDPKQQQQIYKIQGQKSFAMNRTIHLKKKHLNPAIAKEGASPIGDYVF